MITHADKGVSREVLLPTLSVPFGLVHQYVYCYTCVPLVSCGRYTERILTPVNIWLIFSPKCSRKDILI